MIQRAVLTLLTLTLLVCAYAQQPPVVSCGQKDVNEQLFRTNSAARNLHQHIESQLRQYNLRVRQGTEPAQRAQAVVTLPVVVHIIHNNGTENISDAQVLTAIQHLNEAFANTGYYDPANGVNTNIQFCLAQRDPNNNPTNGITRNVSAYTTMGGATYYSDDQSVKNINRWNPSCYINIWVVRSIPGSVAGYAYLPAAHGSNLDGIVLEAGYFGSSYPNDVVIIHEMGHYLGLYHTFEGACTNNDCTTDGDKVCDTPPDQSTASTSCNAPMNSCATDALSGFSVDMDDLTQDYMDYGNFNCMKVFTQGQADRMNWHIQNVRNSLLACKSCMLPCPAPVTANFTPPAGPVNAGTAYTFTNTSINAATYNWYVNGVLQASTANFTYNFPGTGSYTIRMEARSSDALCSDAEKTITLQAVCPVTASFTKSAATVAAGSTINFTNTSAGANTYEWFVNGISQSTAVNFSYSTTTAAKYMITLLARNTVAGCQQEFTDTVEFTCSAVASFTPLSPATLVGTPITFTSNSTGASSGQWIIEGTVAGTNPTITYAFTTPGLYPVKLVVSNGTCSSEATGYAYVSDQCGNPYYLYQKNYGMGLNSGANDIQPASDGGSILATRVVRTAPNFEGALLKLDPSGTLQWVHTYSNGVASRLLKAKQTADGGFITIGEIGNPVKLFIVKTRPIGTIEWSREYAVSTYASGADILQSSDGSYYFTGSTTSPDGLDVLAGQLDATGNLVWMKTYDSRSNEMPVAMIEDNGNLVITGNLPGQVTEGFLLKIQHSDGTALWGNRYVSTYENFRGVQKGTDGYYVDVIRRNTSAGLPTDHVVLKTGFDGSLLMAKYVRPFAGSGKAVGGTGLIIKPNGNFVHQTTPQFGGPLEDVYLQEATPAGAVVWTKRYNKPDAWMSCLARTAENGLIMGGSTVIATAPTVRTYVMRLDSAGNTAGCPVVPVTVDLLDATYNTNALSFTSTALQPQQVTVHTASSFSSTTNVECQITQCDVLPPVDTCGIPCFTNGINGPDSVCNKPAAITYRLQRNSHCTAAATWTFDAAFVDTIATTDSTITLRFKKNGTTTLRSTLITPCKTLLDSLTIAIFDSPGLLQLGPDITLCKISTYTLRAGSGFAAYRWQDGSTDSSFTIYGPGTYFVEAMDHCGNYYRDTVQVTQSADIPFDLGADVVACKNDTVQLTAPGGFTQYYWSPNYSISNRYAARIKVVATKDTLYTVVAEKSPGCLVTDTVRLRVFAPPVIALRDTAICAGEQLELKAPAGFAGYRWFNQATTASVMVTTPGDYWLQVTDVNGCVGSDTVHVSPKNCSNSKGVYFPNAFTPNNDAVNNVFRPVVRGTLQQFHLTIFNRWGQKVFETQDAAKGWNGFHKNTLQPTGTFVWVCTYKLLDGPEQVVRGTVTLIRHH
jgi:gliding motility-associated-like protein